MFHIKIRVTGAVFHFRTILLKVGGPKLQRVDSQVTGLLDWLADLIGGDIVLTEGQEV